MSELITDEMINAAYLGFCHSMRGRNFLEVPEESARAAIKQALEFGLNRRAPEAGQPQSLDERMREAGMISVADMLAGTPIDKFVAHTGVKDLTSFEEWLINCRTSHYRMQAKFELNNMQGDDMYEWYVAHNAVFHEVLVNFRAAKPQAQAEPKPEAGPDVMFEAACSGLRYKNPNACGEVSAVWINNQRWAVMLSKSAEALRAEPAEGQEPALYQIRHALEGDWDHWVETSREHYESLTENIELQKRKLYAQPQRPTDRQLEVMTHDYPKLAEFFHKYAIGNKLAPSCFCCGKQIQEFGVRHLELADIAICLACKKATEAQPQRPAVPDAAREICRLLDDGIEIHPRAPLHLRLKKELTAAPAPERPSDDILHHAKTLIAHWEEFGFTEMRRFFEEYMLQLRKALKEQPNGQG